MIIKNNHNIIVLSNDKYNIEIPNSNNDYKLNHAIIIN